MVKLVDIEKPSIHIIKNTDGSFNFSDILTKKAGDHPDVPASRPKDNGPGLLFKLCRLSIKDADISYQDKASSFGIVVAPLDINLFDFTNAPDQKAGFEVSGKTDLNESFHCAGTLLPAPFSIAGNLSLRRIDLSRYTPLYSKDVGFIIKDGKVDLITSFVFPEKKIQAGTRAGIRAGNGYLVNDTMVKVSSLKLVDSTGGKTILDLPEFSISGLLFSLDRKVVQINDVTTADAAINIERFADGGLNVSRLSGKKTEAPVDQSEKSEKIKKIEKDGGGVSPDANSKTSPAWAVDVDKISVDNYSLRFVDNIPAKPVSLDITPININGISFSNRPGSSGDISFSFKTGKGIFAARGEVSLSPLSVDLDIKADDIGIEPVRPYMAEKTHVNISGAIGGSGHVSVHSKDKVMSGGFTGGVALSNFSAFDASVGEELAKWKRLAFSGIRVNFKPLSISVDNILLQEPGLKIVRLPEGAINLVNALAPPGPRAKNNLESEPNKRPDSSEQTQSSASTPVPVKINSVDVKKGNVVFTDRAISPAFDCTVSDLNIGLRNLVFPGAGKADFTLSGTFQGQARLSVSGELFPLDLKNDTRVNFDFLNIGMPVFTPYFAHYLGYELKKGKLFLKLEYKVENNRMTGKNNLLFDQLYLGNGVKSPAAVNLPLKLALALLRDRNGKISLDVPVKGNFTNPEFSLGKVIYSAFANLVSRMATSPFAAIGSMFKDADQLGFISFIPGKDELVKSQEQKIGKLVYALYERPALQLVIDPGADPVVDGQALVEHEFARRIRSEKVGAKTIEKKSATAGDQISLQADLTEKEYQACLVSACQNAGIKVSGLSQKEQELRLKSLIVISDQELLELAQKRGDVVRDAIRKEKKIKPARIFLTNPRTGPNPRVLFKLKTD
ncbi:MAG: DUF748 domain-containing protein [Deltaproteobacteria bacterium]|nr:DUF748 domain-containing protein [Deltaproteobacteria bacterium]